MTASTIGPMLGMCRDLSDEMDRLKADIEELALKVGEADEAAGAGDSDAIAFDSIVKELNKTARSLEQSRALLAGYVGIKELRRR